VKAAGTHKHPVEHEPAPVEDEAERMARLPLLLPYLAHLRAQANCGACDVAAPAGRATRIDVHFASRET